MHLDARKVGSVRQLLPDSLVKDGVFSRRDATRSGYLLNVFAVLANIINWQDVVVCYCWFAKYWKIDAREYASSCGE